MNKFKLFFSSAFLFSGFICHSQGQPHPNIIWLIAEDMSQDLACYGNELVRTPTIDKLASEGMRFSSMFTTAAVCSPSRTAIATGMYQTSIGAMHMRYSDELKPPLPEGMKTVAHLLKGNGYQTLNLMYGEIFNGKDDYLFKLDKKSFDFKNLDELDKSKPFFAKLNCIYTHRIFKKKTKNPIDPGKVQLPPYYPDVKPLRDDWAAYLENIQLFDQEVKNILTEFENRGLLENTIIFFFSDHGRPMLRGKSWMYDSGIKIPFIIHLAKGMKLPKGYLSGGVNDQLLSSIDISATTLALGGVKKPDYMQGRIFLGEDTEPERECIFASIDRIGGVNFKTRAVRSKKYKYIKNFNNGLSVLECSTEYRKVRLPHYITISILDNYNKLNEVQKTLVTPLPLEELYDLENDPFETNNLAYKEGYEPISEKMGKILLDWISKIDDKGFVPDSPEIQKHFIDYRTKNQESFRELRLKSYLEIERELREEGDIF